MMLSFLLLIFKLRFFCPCRARTFAYLNGQFNVVIVIGEYVVFLISSVDLRNSPISWMGTDIEIEHKREM